MPSLHQEIFNCLLLDDILSSSLRKQFFYFLPALGLCCCVRAFSSCRARAPGRVGFSELQLKGLVAPWQVGSSQTRAQTCVPCIGKQILNHWTTREVRFQSFFFCMYGSTLIKEISPEYSLEGLMLKLKFQHFGNLMQRTDSFEMAR